MNSKVGYVFFLTAGLLAILGLLLFHPVQLSADSKPILESVLGALSAILMSAIHSVFHVDTPSVPTPPVTPASGEMK